MGVELACVFEKISDTIRVGLIGTAAPKRWEIQGKLNQKDKNEFNATDGEVTAAIRSSLDSEAELRPNRAGPSRQEQSQHKLRCPFQTDVVGSSWIVMSEQFLLRIGGIS